MGTAFWWAFDIGSVALILVSIYFSAKKGFSKTFPVLLGCILCILTAGPLSRASAEFVYKNSVRRSNISTIEKAVDDQELFQKVKSGLENMGYRIKTDTQQLEEVFGKDDPITELYVYAGNINGKAVDTEENFRKKTAECFSSVTETLLTHELTQYEASKAAEIIKNDPESFCNVMSLLSNNDDKAAAEYIEENFTSDASQDIIKIFCFIIIIFVIMLLARTAAQIIGKGASGSRIGEITETILSGIFGAAESFVVLTAAAAAVKALIIVSSDSMLLFNTETIDKTLLFKYIYLFMETR